MENERINLKLSGAGSANGGFFNEVKLSGACNVNGDVDCNFLSGSGACDIKGSVTSKQILLSGACNIKGSVKTEILKCSGACDIRGDLEAVEVSISGGADIRGNVKSKKLDISGGCDIDGNVSGEEIKLSGGIKIKDDCECENFNAKGSFSIGGLLNAEKANIVIYDTCSVKEIGGKDIDIRYSSHMSASILKFIKTVFTNSSPTLESEIIEGDNIYLDHTTAKVVRGNKITIGDSCNIDKIEYKDSLNVTGNSQIGEKVKL
ncbi:polymer-forming cytoskeletal protein [Clostridium hydrogenum]|uniref:polymer-forming cytoskeletal protein n=1 Tax=Clostridium hydrogenum TaxID=2855764 RepID=UPI001F3D7B22|nr:polymer-forming cytoskeletal protein [Clostridium hydrogenum]